MANATMMVPFSTGMLIGYQWMRNLGFSLQQAKEGAVFSGLWMTTAMIISHRSLEWQGRNGADNKMVNHAIGITSIVLALMSGPLWDKILTKSCGFSIPNQLLNHLGGAALITSLKAYNFYFHLR